jgi:hypothetical protein
MSASLSRLLVWHMIAAAELRSRNLPAACSTNLVFKLPDLCFKFTDGPAFRHTLEMDKWRGAGLCRPTDPTA